MEDVLAANINELVIKKLKSFLSSGMYTFFNKGRNITPSYHYLQMSVYNEGKYTIIHRWSSLSFLYK